MWSDTPDPAAVRSWADQLQRVLPAPDPGACCTRAAVAGDTSAEAVAAHARGRPGLAWLDGGSRTRHLVACEPLAQLCSRAGQSRASGPGGEAVLECDGFELLHAAQLAWGAGGHGRFFGYLGYELAGRIEQLPPPPLADVDVPDLWLGLHDRWLERDQDGWTAVSTEGWRRDPCAPLVELAARSVDQDLPDDDDPELAVGLTSTPDDAGFQAAVARTVSRIHAGEIFQTNLCRRLSGVMPEQQAWPLYRRLRARGDANHGAYLDLGAAAVLSRSPERFLRRRGPLVESDPIKGTRRRGTSRAEDLVLRQSLLRSAKDRAELAMIVDLVRNDLGRVCEPGSVRVRGFPSLMKLDQIWHTWARVRGRLGEGVGTVELLRAAFPPGSITGAPKIQAMVVAGEEETSRRGPAMGALGWIGLDGDLELSVAIRTAVVGSGRVVYHAGCGIVADSDPALEAEESLLKARGFLAAIGA